PRGRTTARRSSLRDCERGSLPTRVTAWRQRHEYLREPRAVDRREGRLSLEREPRRLGRLRAVYQRAPVHGRCIHTGLRANSASVGVRYLPHVALLRQRVLLIVNPGSRRGMRREAQARSAFAHRGVACDIVLTERPGHAGEVARQRGCDYDAVFTL